MNRRFVSLILAALAGLALSAQAALTVVSGEVATGEAARPVPQLRLDAKATPVPARLGEVAEGEIEIVRKAYLSPIGKRLAIGVNRAAEPVPSPPPHSRARVARSR